jgi:ferric-dicitrate binding protein FerR (iron transport regulator)
MHFENFEAEDLLMEESFRNYCLQNNETDVQFWERWIMDHPEKIATVREAKELFRVLNGNITAIQFKQDQAEFNTKVEQHLNGEGAAIVRKAPFRKIFLYTGIAAASVLLFVFISRVLVQQDKLQPNGLRYSDVRVSDAGERKSFQLPDGSTVLLNSGTTIKIADNFNGSTREVSLVGEAYFDVTKNPEKPFIIHTEVMDVKVLGTVFNVKAYSGDKTAETSLIEGSVEVTLRNAGNKTILLRPKQKITASMNSATKDYVVKEIAPETSDTTASEISWTKNRLVFTNNSFEEIAIQLQRWYGVELIFDNEAIKQFRFTATFDQKSITQVLEALKLSRDFDYRIEENNKIRILN